MDNVKPRISVPIKNFKRTISGPVVKDDIFEILKSLVQDAVDALYNKYGMTLIGWWIPGHESLISSKPIPDVPSIKDFKFRSPPGMESMIFSALGAKPIVMDFGEVPTALQTGLIDGADYSSLATNYAGGHYEQNKYATYP